MKEPRKPGRHSKNGTPQTDREAAPRTPLLIWGAGGHAKVVADIARIREHYFVAGFIDDLNADRSGQPFCGSNVYGIDRLPLMWLSGVRQAIVAIGDCETRLINSWALKQAGFELATLIHPSATIAADVSLGEGTVVAAGAVINPGTTIGTAVIINSGAVVEHDCVVDDGAHICPGVKLAGQVRIGAGAWIGIGSTIIERITIGRCAFIAAGSLILSSIDPCVVAYGAPARQIKRPTTNEVKTPT